MFKNKAKPQMMNQQVCLAETAARLWDGSVHFLCKGEVGVIKSCYDDGGFGVRLYSKEDALFALREEGLYFPNHPLGYNQPCFNQ